MFDDGEKTILAQENIFSLDYSSFLPGIEIIEKFDDIKLFRDAVKERSLSLGFVGETDTELISFVINLCKNAKAEISRQTLSNWITTAAPNGSSQSRNNVYKLCFALGFDEKETAEFFLKAYLEKPFNYKSINECVYYYCLKNKLIFSEAERIINEIAEDHTESNTCEESTALIARNISNINTEKRLKEYIIQNRSGFSNQGKTAIEKIYHLIDKCKETAYDEVKLNPELLLGGKLAETINKEENREEKKKGKKVIINLDTLLDIIYDFSARETTMENGKRKNVISASIKDSRFPTYIKTNFPQRQQLQNIIQGKASSDSIRKALIILEFYSFFGEAKVRKRENENFFDEFTDELNTLLEECGYIQMYWRNPLDWVIGYCANADEPLDEFRGLIYELYLSEIE